MKKKVSFILSIVFVSLLVMMLLPHNAFAGGECDHYVYDYETCTKVDADYHEATGICEECGQRVTIKEEHDFEYSAEKFNKTYHKTTYTCSYCGYSYTTQEKHDWDDWETAKKATVFKKGKKVRECIDCGTTQSKSIKRVNPFAKFKKKTYSLVAGKTLKLKTKIKMGRGDSVKTWKSSNNSIASVSKYGKIKAKRKGTVKITAILKSGKKATCNITVKAPAKKKTTKKRSSGSTVYWVPSGDVYHVSRNCRTLKRSRTVYSGTIEESGKSRCCKVCG